MVSVSSFGRGKLVEMMSWLELNEAAGYLGSLMGENIGQLDLLRLALEGHLTLSVRLLSGATVLKGTTIPLAEAKRHRLPTLEGDGFFVSIEGTVIPETQEVIVYEDRMSTIVDVWDLPMLGGERYAIEDLYEQTLMRASPELFNLEGAFVTDSKGTYCKFMERYENRDKDTKPYDAANFYPAAGLPADGVIVARTEVLKAFAARHSTTPAPTETIAERPLETRERTTLLTLIAALAQLAKVDISRPSAAAAAIESETVRMGARVASRTIENHLKRIPAALEARLEED